jgi:uncharacterized damage-inducible protein DinB
MSGDKPAMDPMGKLRSHLIKILDWGDAHVDFESAVEGIPADLRGERPVGLPYSPWELLEHMRRTQRDILDFCRDPAYKQPEWPDDYWPGTARPPSAEAWEESLDAFRADRQALKGLTADPKLDLFDEVPQGDGQTYLREVLLVADHNSYHLGELVAVRRLLGAWR